MDLEEAIRERLAAYIYPNKARTSAQQQAFESAVEAQLEYEESNPAEDLPPNVQSVSVGKYSVTAKAGQSEYTRSSICPAAWAFLFNAGLLKRALPVARRL